VESLLVQYATINVPSDVDELPGDVAPGVASSVAQRLRSLESEVGAQSLQATIETLEQADAYGSSWLTKEQGSFLRSWLDAVQAERLEAQGQLMMRVRSEAPVRDEPYRPAPKKAEVAPVGPTAEEFLREIFGAEIASHAAEKLRELPALAQVESRVIALEGVAGYVLGSQGADQTFALVSKLVAANPHLLEISDFDAYCTQLTQTVLRIEKLGLKKPLYDPMASPGEFSGLSSLVKTNALIDMAASYTSAVSALNDAKLPGEGIMALLRYGFFFQGRLQFGPCVGEDRMVLENVDRQSPESFPHKELEKGLTALHQAGIISRPSRGHGSFLSRSAVPGSKNEGPLSKALAWVVAHPDPRVEF
jgi:hypothetical protein